MDDQATMLLELIYGYHVQVEKILPPDIEEQVRKYFTISRRVIH